MPNIPMPAGVQMTDLKCVMIDLEPLHLHPLISRVTDDGVVPVADLYYGEHPNLKYAQGLVGDETPHITVLFGIHPSENYPDNALQLLADTGIAPQTVTVESIDTFPSTVEGEDYVCVVAKIDPNEALETWYQALTELPYTNRFTDYVPHITLAYLKSGEHLGLWIEAFEQLIGREIAVTGVNDGLSDD